MEQTTNAGAAEHHATAAQRAEFWQREAERYRAAYRFLVAAFDGAAAIAGDDEGGQPAV